MKKLNDEWETPKELFDILDKGGVYQGITFEGFNFDIDLCATKENSKCNMYCTDYLKNKYNQLIDPFRLPGDLVMNDETDLTKFGDSAYYKENVNCFMNPPYSNPKRFIEKAWEDSKYCRIVCLLKCDPSASWWATFWNYVDLFKCWWCTGKEVTKNSYGYYCSRCGATSPKTGGVEGARGLKPGCEVIFFHKRIKFNPHKSLLEKYNSNKGIGIRLPGSTFPSCLVILDRRNA